MVVKEFCDLDGQKAEGQVSGSYLILIQPLLTVL